MSNMTDMFNIASERPMLNILADTFMTATRTGAVRARDIRPKTVRRPRRRWLPLGHWWTDPPRYIDLDKL